MTIIAIPSTTNRRSTLRIIIPLAALMTCLSPSVATARPVFQRGQKVEFDHGGVVAAGEVISITETGQVKIRYQEDGKDLVGTYPPSSVWLPKRIVGPQVRQQFEQRSWWGADGERKAVGRFVNLIEGKVTVQKDSGGSATIALEDLAEKDQAMAKRFAEKVAAMAASERPVVRDAPIGDAAVIPMENEPTFDLADDEKVVAPDGDWSAVQDATIDLSAGSGFLPDGFAFDPNDMPRSIVLDPAKAAGRRNFTLEEFGGFLVDRQRERLVVVTTNSERGGSLYGPRLEFCNLRDGQSTAALVLNTSIAPCDLSPDGQLVVCMPSELVASFSKRRGIEVWRLDKEGTLVKRWNPNDTRA